MFQLKKRIRGLLILAAALMILFNAVPITGFTAAGSRAEETETVSSYPYTTKTKVKVNLRARRSVRSELLRHIPAGATITVNSVSKSSGWAQVEYGKYSGYVKSEYIIVKEVKKVKVTPTPTPVPTLSPEEDAQFYRPEDIEEPMAEGADSDWYMDILADANMIAEYPYHAFVDINGNGVPVLLISTTQNSFITAEMPPASLRSTI